MHNLILEKINWKQHHCIFRDECRLVVADTTLNKATKTLTLDIRVNFIVPIEALKTIENDMVEKIDIVDQVIFNFSYYDVYMEKEHIVDYFVPHIFTYIDQNYSHLSRALNRNRFSHEGDVLKLYAVGEFVVKSLNDRAKKDIEKQLNHFFGINSEVVFEACEERYNVHEKGKSNATHSYLPPQASASGTNNDKKPVQQPKPKVKLPKGDVVLGKRVTLSYTDIKDIKEELDEVAIRGEVFEKNVREIKNGKKIVNFLMTDLTDSISIKMFLKDEKFERVDEEINKGTFIKVKGKAQYDTFDKSVVIMAKDIEKYQVAERMDTSEEKRIELHCHTKMSSMDGLMDTKTIVKKAAMWGHEAVSITDHGVLQAFPDAMLAAKDSDIKVLYGVEGYLVDDLNEDLNYPKDLSINGEYVVFDLETTGLSPSNHEIIEIGAVRIVDQKIEGRFQAFVKPKGNIPINITTLTGIDNQMVADADDIETVYKLFLDFVGDAVLVAHNASFDCSFMNVLSERFDIPLNNEVLDTLRFSRILLPNLKRHKLEAVAKFFKIPQVAHHRADDDAIVTGKILLKLFELMEKKNILNLCDIVTIMDDESYKRLDSYHVIIFAKDYKGLKSLYKLVSMAHMDYFYKKPRIPKSLLIEMREGLIIGSACQAGEVYQSILNRNKKEDIEKIASFYDYLEVQPLDNNAFLIDNGKVKDYDGLININKEIISLGNDLNKLVVATCDAHYFEQEDAVYRQILMAGLGFKDIEEDTSLYFRTTREMLDAFSYLDEDTARELVIHNPKKISAMIEDIIPVPNGTFPPSIEGSEETLRDLCWGKAKSIYGEEIPEIVQARLDRELNSIISNGYAVMYVIAHKLVAKSNEDGYLVGSRGSVGSSFAATMSSITEVNPLPPHYVCPDCKHSIFITDGSYGCGVDMPDKPCEKCGTDYIKEGFDIPFEVFLGFDGDKEPDIDLNFAGEYQSNAHKYTEELFGSDKVFRAGTIGTVAFKTAYGFVRKFHEEQEKIVNKWEVERLSDNCTGVKRTTGQHPGGVMVVPKDKDIFDFCPIQYPANDGKSGVITTHFDYHSIEGRLLKLDILGHDVPTIIRMLEDITGVPPEDVPLKDEGVDEIFKSTKSLNILDPSYKIELGSLGIPEFGTKFVRQMLLDTKPESFSDLIRISGLSHGTDVWINNAQDIIAAGTAKLRDVIATRDDIMNYLILKGIPDLKAFKIMELVRKGKGGKIAEEDIELMKEKVPGWYVDSCLTIKYMFPKAHAVAYVMMSYRIAYFKVYYPLAFYAVYFSIKVTDFNSDVIFEGKKGILKRIDELESKDMGLVQKEKDELTVLEISLEMYCRGFEFMPVNLEESDATSFKVIGDQILPPFMALQGVGENAAKALAVERTKGEFSSIESLKKRSKINKTAIEALTKHKVLKDIPESDQLSLF